MTEHHKPTKFSRAMFIRYGALGAAAIAAGSHLNPLMGAAPAYAADEVPRPADPNAPGPVLPPNRSGGIPAGPSTYGFWARDVLAWSPAEDPHARHFVCHIPRAERIAPFAATQAHPSLDPSTQMLAIDGDYRGSIYDERARAIGDEDYAYTFRYWQYLDFFSSWHGQLRPTVPADAVIDRSAAGREYGVLEVPNAGWTEAAHKNGARSLGCWFWPRTGENFAALVQRTSDGRFPVADKMIEIRRYFGFDGYFLNQEAPVPAREARAFKDMMAYLKSKDPQCYLQYYDAMLESGQLSYQNCINARNVGWLGTPEKPLMDSIFMNYGWLRGWRPESGTGGPDPDLTKSADTVRSRGFDPKQVAFGTTEFQQGGFNPSEIFGDLANPQRNPPVSWGTFVTNELWNQGCSDGSTRTILGRSIYRDLEQKFWSGPAGNPARSGRRTQPTEPYRKNSWNVDGFDGVAHSIVEKSPYGSLPINTTFNIGVGSSFTLAGSVVSDRPWNNAGIADPVPSWQYWVEDTGAVTEVSLDETQAWEGAHSLRWRSRATAAVASTLHLFKTDLQVAATDTVQVVIRAGQPLPRMALVMTYRTDPLTSVTVPLRANRTSNGWSVLEGSLRAVSGRVARISLHATAGSGLDLRLGQVRIGQSKAVPSTPADFAATSATVRDAGAEVYFAWTLAAGAHAYEVFAVDDASGARTWLGRCHRDCFFAEKLRVPADRVLRFELVALAKDGRRSAPAAAAIVV